MKTEILSPSEQNLQKCGEWIRKGEIVCFPTETVYGLGANAMDDAAVCKIFAVKNRPANNPLIAHISDFEMIHTVAREIPSDIIPLTEHFWPGPLTIVLPRRAEVAPVVSAGLDTVAVRCPDHPVAQELIRRAGVPIVAPSANLSGRPSPTCCAHCIEDLNERIAAIIDGGSCEIGVESTVLLPLGERRLKLLRPGGITVDMLEALGFTVEADPAILAPVKEGQAVSSPGMLYRHYAPKAPLTIVTGEDSEVLAALKKQQADDTWFLVFEEYLDQLDHALSFGNKADPLSQSRALYEALRRFDSLPCKKIYAMYPSADGMGLALRNRLLRAASFQIIPAERL